MMRPRPPRARAIVLGGVSLLLVGAHAGIPAVARAATCVGDSHGGGDVSMAEVQRAANIFLRIIDVATCPNADRNGDGRVSIAEVQAAADSFLRGPNACPTLSGNPTNVPAASETASVPPTQPAPPLLTPTPAPTATATATATATMPLAMCGNGFIENGETCKSCPADCTVRSCTATTPLRTFSVNITFPADQTVSGLTLLVGYKSGTVSLPGSGAATSVGSRLKNRPSNAIFAFNDLDYALRTVVSRSGGFISGRLYTIDFDSCNGAPAPTAANFGCTVEGCSNTFGSVTGCTCSVSP